MPHPDNKMMRYNVKQFIGKGVQGKIKSTVQGDHFSIFF